MTYFILIFTAIIFLTYYWIWYSSPKLPSNTDALIQEVMSSELPEFMTGESGFVQNGNIKICYEFFENKTSNKGTILLVNGHTQSLLEWPSYFLQPLLDAGYQVVRYDNRGFGCSDWIKDWSRENAYQLEDMATDGIAVLDHLGIQKAHLIGVSMGGMISQRIAISYSDRVSSLTSIMSTGFYFDPELISTPKPFVLDVVKLTMRYKRTLHLTESKLKFYLGIREMLRGKGYDLDTKLFLQQGFYELSKRNGLNAKGTDQHSYAIKKSGSRYDELKNIKAPTLVIHGTADTLILVNHAEKYAPMIPDAELLIIKGMGHDLPKEHAPKMVSNILSLLEKANKKEASIN